MTTIEGLSIGAVSKATNIPTNTLRTWENRYGFPIPLRQPNGRRLYDKDTVAHLILLKRVLDQGQRPAEVVGLGMDELYEKLPQEIKPIQTPPEQYLEVWLHHVIHGDMRALQMEINTIWYTLGPIACMDNFIGPFLHMIGNAWASGKLSVAQEHMASECLRDLLVMHWRPLSNKSNGPLALCTTLPGERHNIGLHMVAATLAICGHKILFLGTNTPIVDIVDSMQNQINAVFISCAHGANTEKTKQDLNHIAKHCKETCLVVGGAGVPHDNTNLTFDTFEDLASWAVS